MPCLAEELVATEWTLVPGPLTGTWAVPVGVGPGRAAAPMPSLSCYLAPSLAPLLSLHVRMWEPYKVDK